MSDASKKKDYEVGDCRPPASKRFRAGTSGNPKGRPKTARSTVAVLHKQLFAQVSIVENGRRRKITVLEAFVAKVIKDTFAGDSRAQDKLMKLLPLVDHELARDVEMAEVREQEEQQSTTSNDRAVLEAMAEMLGASAERLFPKEEAPHD